MRRAILSVSDKSGLPAFATGLVTRGFIAVLSLLGYLGDTPAT